MENNSYVWVVHRETECGTDIAGVYFNPKDAYSHIKSRFTQVGLEYMSNGYEGRDFEEVLDPPDDYMEYDSSFAAALRRDADDYWVWFVTKMPVSGQSPMPCSDDDYNKVIEWSGIYDEE